VNKRIQELADQAKVLDYSTWDSYNQKTIDHYKFDKEKFAQLIVQECLTQVDKMRDVFEADGEDEQALGVEWVGLAIAKHFGVEL
jgi:hypothetical protein